MTKRHGCKSVAFCFTAPEDHSDLPMWFSPRGEPCTTAYWLAPEAGAAAEAAASEAAAPASEAAAAGAEAADASLAGAAAWSLLLLHAASATAANRDATRRDFFMITSFYG